MKIKVTAEDIARGLTQDPCRCPIALACERLGFSGADVEGERAGFLSVPDAAEEDGWIRYRLPKSALVFVRDFDAENPVEPFEFEVA